jgi:hypothetical protein
LDVYCGDGGFMPSSDLDRMKERASRRVGEINRTEYSMKGTHAIGIRNGRAKAIGARGANLPGNRDRRAVQPRRGFRNERQDSG